MRDRSPQGLFGVCCVPHPGCRSSPALHRQHLAGVAAGRWVLLSTGIVSTELTVVGARDAPISLPTETAPAERGGQEVAGDVEFASGHLAWLAVLRDLLKEEGGPVGVLGSSIAANWLIPHAPERVSYILDEDSNRHGGTLFGCPIIAPGQALAGLPRGLPVGCATCRSALPITRTASPHGGARNREILGPVDDYSPRRLLWTKESQRRQVRRQQFWPGEMMNLEAKRLGGIDVGLAVIDEQAPAWY